MQDFAGNQTKYKQILEKFIVQQSDDVETAGVLFRAGDAQGAIRLLHDLSGIASVLRATDFARLTMAAESALLNGTTETLPGLFDQMKKAWAILKVSAEQFSANVAGHQGK